MSKVSSVFQNLISAPVVSVVLLVCSGLWSVSACEYFATSGLRSDWSATPMFWMLLIIVTPAICFTGGMIVVDAGRRSRFSMLDWWALVSAFLPVTLGTLLSVWAVRVLLGMAGRWEI